MLMPLRSDRERDAGFGGIMRVTMCALHMPVPHPRCPGGLLKTACTFARVLRHRKVAGRPSALEEDLDGSFTFLDLKALISDTTEIEATEMRILHKGRAVQDGDTLENAGA